MLFNSINFFIFLPIVFLLYWFVLSKKIKWQNTLLLVSSYFFYACWDWRFLFLLMFSTLLDYFSGIQIEKANNSKQSKVWLWLSIVINLGFLAVFKYYNFFIGSVANAFGALGFQFNPFTFNLILPVGISFYTFHGLSYILDIYYKRIKAEKNFVDYAVFVSFFPLLIAGPIERATHLLPQIKKCRIPDYIKAVDGLRQILWGLFKKIVIADHCAKYANLIFNNTADYSGTTLLLGAIFFAFQIYGDFSGYSDIALGTARLFGIDLLRNFAFPYFSRDIAEFWRRWHISLSSWFRDYVYIPLGGNKGTTYQKIRNIFIIFLVSGFWHGANWTFIAWGILNAIFFLPLMLRNKNRNHIEIVAMNSALPSLKEAFQILTAFILTCFAWIFFRADSISHAVEYLSSMFSGLTSMSSYLQTLDILYDDIGIGLLAVLFSFIGIEWVGRRDQYAIANFGLRWKWPLRYAFYYSIILLIFWFEADDQQFIYFQF